MEVNRLLLLSKNDIPFPEGRLVIHQPTIKEIGYIGEKNFYQGCSFLALEKNTLPIQDKNNLCNQSNFEIIMSTIENAGKDLKCCQFKVSIQMVLALIFPDYQISFAKNKIIFDAEDIQGELNNQNYGIFQSILKSMFRLDIQENEETNYNNPTGALSQRIIDKLNERHKILANLKGGSEESKDICILSRYVSILAVGEHKDMNSLLNYSVYQLHDEYERFILHTDQELYIRGKLAGAKDMQEVENWIKDLYS